MTFHLYNHPYSHFEKNTEDLNAKTMALSMHDGFHHTIISILCAPVLIQPLASPLQIL